MTDSTAPSLEDLQARVAFLDQELKDVRDSVTAHQQQILALEKQCEVLTDRLRDALLALQENSGGDLDGHEIPPHY
ncbi:MAG: SlyX family protein [Pseudomonadota bacterium]